MSNLIRCVLLTLLFSWPLHGEPIIEGSSRIDVAKVNADDLYKEGINQALANAIENYIATYHKEYQPFFKHNVRRDLLVERAPQLVSRFQLIQPQKVQQNMLITELRAEFQIDQLKQRLSKFAVINRVEQGGKSQFAVFFFAREKTNNGQFKPLNINDDELELAIKQELQQSGFVIMDSQQFEVMSGGNFRRTDLANEFVKTGRIDWQQARIAARMAALKQTDVYMLSGSFEVEFMGFGEFEPELRLYQVRGLAEIVNTSNDQSQGVLSDQDEFSHTSADIARQQGIKEIGRRLAEKISAVLYSNQHY